MKCEAFECDSEGRTVRNHNLRLCTAHLIIADVNAGFTTPSYEYQQAAKRGVLEQYLRKATKHET